jgi:hypothetical protein
VLSDYGLVFAALIWSVYHVRLSPSEVLFGSVSATARLTPLHVMIGFDIALPHQFRDRLARQFPLGYV